MVGQFLDYARLDQQEPVAATNLKALAESAAALFHGRAQGLSLQLAELPPAPVRPLLLKRALTNLLDNAIKHGGGDIVLQLQAAQWQGRPAVQFSVLDRGPGIAAHAVESAKRPFVRLDAARGSAGSGLGLAIVERAARLHSGELRLEPRQGGGLEATLAIPLAAGGG